MSSSEHNPLPSGGTHDRRLADLLQRTDENIAAAASRQDLVQVIRQVAAFDGSLKYQHTRPKQIALAIAAVAVAIAGYGYLVDPLMISNVQTLLIICAVAILGLIIYMWRKGARVKGLAESLYQRAVLFANNLREMDDEIVGLEEKLFADFREFKRGNHSRDISEAYQGRYSGATHSFSYYFYHFHYVDERQETHTDSKGNRETRTEYTHYHRYGIMMPFHFVSQLAISGFSVSGLKGSRYKPSSNQFNRLFKVVADSEMTAARFLKPAIVLACEEAATVFKKLNLEFNSEGELCVSFANNKVLDSQQQHDFSAPEAFIGEIEQELPLPELAQALNFIHTLMIYSDSNFKRGD